MRIHFLTIQGFGPFKDKQEIDFDALSQDKIFMLEGPTGAGKSSIIDAIVFALYGVTAHEAATKSGPAGQRVRRRAGQGAQPDANRAQHPGPGPDPQQCDEPGFAPGRCFARVRCASLVARWRCLIGGGHEAGRWIPALKFAHNALTVAIDVRANLHHRGAPITTGQRGQVWLWW